MSKTKKIIIGAAMAALLPAVGASASPLVNVRLVLNGNQGAIGNDGDSVANIATAAVGQTINVRLETQLAAIGTTNATMNATITSKTDFDGSNAATSDGINAIRFDVRNGPGTGAVADFDSTFTLSSEAQGTGSTGGTLVSKGTSTASSVDPDELQGTKGVGPTSTPFQFSANAWRSFATGVLKISSLGDGISNGSVGPVLSFSSLNAPAALFINGHSPVGPTYANQNTGVDKPVGYQGLTLAVPEPSSLGLLGMAAAGLIRRRRKA